MNDKKTIKTRIEWHKKNAGFQADDYFDPEKALTKEDHERMKYQVEFKKFCLAQNLRLNSFTLQVIQQLISKIVRQGLSPKKAQEILTQEFGKGSTVSDKEKSYVATNKP